MSEKNPCIKTLSDLICEYYTKHPNGHFFDRDTLKFFGERRSDMRLLKAKSHITDASGCEHTCYVISCIQRPGPPLTPRRVYHYFDINTLDDICT